MYIRACQFIAVKRQGNRLLSLTSLRLGLEFCQHGSFHIFYEERRAVEGDKSVGKFVFYDYAAIKTSSDWLLKHPTKLNTPLIGVFI